MSDEYLHVYFEGQAEEVLRRVAEAVRLGAVSVDELLQGIEALAVLSTVGASPADVIGVFLAARPHLHESIRETVNNWPVA